jgi:hypothetical protein
LAVADNVNITRINILEPRRGFEYQYNGANVLTFGSSGDRVKKFVFWKESNYIHYASTFALFSGSGVSSRGTLVTPSNATSVRDVSFSNKNLYLTNSTGLLKTDAVATSLYSAGVPKGLAISVTDAGIGTAVGASKYVSYRYLIGRKDANGNTVLGAPSGRVTFQNPSASDTANVNVVCEIPSGLDSSYFIQIYRSAESSTSETSDEMYLVYERFLTATTSVKNISQVSRGKIYDDVYQVEVVTSTAHGFVTGQKITVAAVTNTGINGSYYITRFSDTLFQYTQIGALSTISLTSDTGTVTYPGDFSAQVAAILDTTPSDLTGATLYTSPSQEGAVNENNEPPVASDIAEYQNLMWYADTQSKQRITLSLISSVPVLNTTVTIGSETYTFRSFANYKEHIVKAPTYKVMLSTVAKSGNTVTVTTSQAHELLINEYINFQPSNDPTNLAKTNIQVKTVPTSTSFTLDISAGSNISPAAADTGFFTKNSDTATTSALAINETAESLIRNINLNPDGVYYAYSASSADDTFPGRIIIEARSYAQTQFSVTSSQPTYWQPQLVSPAQNDNKSQNDAFRNGLMYSKADQPEAVPYKNIFRVGSADDPILRIWAARDALFVFKKRDGLWIIRGETEANFTKNQLDSTAKLFAPDSLTSVNNNLYALMEAGICEISDTGVNVISFPIRDQLFQNYTTYAANTYSYAFGVGNDIDGKYILSLPTSSTNSYCEKQIVYDVYSKIFCGNWSIESTAGRLNQIDAKVYLGPTSNKIKKELRTFLATDFVDEYQTLSITSVDATGLILTLSSVSGLSVNDVIKQGSVYVYLLAVDNSNNTVTVDMIESWTTGVANVVHYKALDVKVEWNSEFAGNPAGFKHFYEMSLLQKSSFLITSTFYFRNDINASENSITIAAPSYSGNWGDFTWGEEVWGGDPSSNTPVRLGVPRTHARCSQLRVRWEHKVAYSDFQVQGISLAYNPTSTRITNNAAQ